ncbi:MAG: hypothetical protein HS113_09310 [Verrucomicrobiales bacterium]|nr:hypothetical protein [Verrucomicrobiales bacterium]
MNRLPLLRLLALTLTALSRLEGAGLTFESATNGFWAVNNATEAYAWSDPDRRRPQAG